MCGIFAYLNYNVNRERSYILQVLFNGLRRLEYRGYDSAGISIDRSSSDLPPPLVFRQEGNIESLVKSVYQGLSHLFILSLQLIQTIIICYDSIKYQLCLCVWVCTKLKLLLG